jgi:UDP-N-acetylmuramyl pentapeptide synthase
VSDNLKAKGCGRRFSYNVCGEEQRFCFTCTSAIALNLQERAEKAEAKLKMIKQVAIHTNQGNAIIPSSMILGDES